jgi:hypothetical protein
VNDNYDRADSGEDVYGIRWEIGTGYENGGAVEGRLHVHVGDQTVMLDGTEREKFAEAVARAAMPGQVDGGPEIIAQHLKDCTPAKAAVIVDGSADDLIAGMTAAGWLLGERVDRIAGKRIRFLTVPYRRPCCDHCNNSSPEGHDYVSGGSPHDGPCEECAAEQARREHDEGTG